MLRLDWKPLRRLECVGIPNHFQVVGGIVGSRFHLQHNNLNAFVEENSCSQLVFASRYVQAARGSRVTVKASGRVMKRDNGLVWATLHPWTVIGRQEESGDSKDLAGMVSDDRIQSSSSNRGGG